MESFLTPWLIWFVIAVILLIAEIFTPGFLLACFSAGAAGSGLVALLGGGLIFQLVVFVVVTLVVFFGIRPFVIKRLKSKEVNVPTNVDRLVGLSGRVVQAIDNSKDQGRAVVGGEDWRAVSAADGLLEEGSRVKVERVEGTKLVVSPE